MSDITPPLGACRNCGHRLAPWDHFCSACGQDTQAHAPSFWEFVHEWSLHYVAAEGKLWKSLWALIARPGFLTLEYLAGRKQRYVLPLRLLLTFGLLFFLALKLTPSPMGEVVEVKGSPEAAQQAASAAAQDLAQAGLPPVAASAVENVVRRAAQQQAEKPNAPLVIDPEDRARLPAWLRAPAERVEQRFAANREAFEARFQSAMLSLAPYVVLMSLPLFAGLLKLLYPRTVYGAHFVFALHLHAAWYLMLLLVVVFNNVQGVLLAIWAWSNLYPLLALKRVHGSPWFGTLLRGLALALLHWIVIVLMLLLLLAAGVLSA